MITKQPEVVKHSHGDLAIVIPVPKGVTYAQIQNVSADKVLGSVAGGSVEEIACTAAGRALLDDANAAAQATTLGLGAADGPSHAHLHLTDTPATGGALITADESWIGPSATYGIYFKSANVGIRTYTPGSVLDVNGAGHFQGSVTATSYITGSPYFVGDALALLSGIKGDKKGDLDHATLPKEVLCEIYDRDADDKMYTKPGCDIGMLVMMQTVAIQQIVKRLEKGGI